jgi:hypothetical protein
VARSMTATFPLPKYISSGIQLLKARKGKRLGGSSPTNDDQMRGLGCSA